MGGSLRSGPAHSRAEGTTAGTPGTRIDEGALLARVQQLYRSVAERPHERLHFETGRGLAERLGYPRALLDAVPAGAVESFAGVGYVFHLAGLAAGESVLDLGSGSGMDSFIAGVQVGDRGRVVGVDVTDAQREKATRLAAEQGVAHVRFVAGNIQELPFEAERFDAVISNGVINLAPDKDAVCREAARVLRPGGRLAIADIVTEAPLTQAIVADVDLWASCIGGAPQQDGYEAAITRSGLHVERTTLNRYEFLSDQARAASRRFGVRSVSVRARKPLARGS